MNDLARGIAYAVEMVVKWRDTFASVEGNADKFQAFEALRQNLEDARVQVASWTAPYLDD